MSQPRKRKHALFSLSPESHETLARLCRYWGVPRSRIMDLLIARAELALSGKLKPGE